MTETALADLLAKDLSGLDLVIEVRGTWSSAVARWTPPAAVLDGAKALAAAVKEVFDHPVIGRCQLRS